MTKPQQPIITSKRQILARDARARKRTKVRCDPGQEHDPSDDTSSESSQEYEEEEEEKEEGSEDQGSNDDDDDASIVKVGSGAATAILNMLGIRPTGRNVPKNPFVLSENEAYSKYSKVEQDFFWQQDPSTQEVITKEERKIRSLAEDDIPIRFRVLSCDVHPTVKSLALKKLDALRCAPSPDSGKSLEFVNALVRLPIGKYETLKVNQSSSIEEVRCFLKDMRSRLDQRVYGHVDAKAHIIRLLAQYVMNPQARGLVIGFHGPPGCGKTELAKAVCECLQLPFGFIALGGSNDSSALAGHSYTYEGSSWGKIADILMRCNCMNPVLFFDELDKISDSAGGRQVANLLVHLTDPTQNDKFSDGYFQGVDLDISRSVVIFSYNDVSQVNPVLRDRIVEVATEGYTPQEKVVIAMKHLIPFTRSEFGYSSDDFTLDERTIRRIIDVICVESGVRNLKRAIREIAGAVNLSRLMEGDMQAPLTVTYGMVDSMVKSGRRDADRSIHAIHMMYN